MVAADGLSRRSRLAVPAAAIVLVAAAVIAARRPRAFVAPPGVAVWGVDVSHHQGAIDWPTVAAQPGLRFAYVKATEGGDWVDPRFAENWRAARASGVRVGAYHYFTFCRPAAEQAALFLRIVPREAGALPPAVDVEQEGNCASPPPRETIAAELAAWLADVERALGRRPVVYVTAWARDTLLAGRSLENPVWLRSTDERPPAGARWRFWQLSSGASVPGIPTDVDVDAFDGDARALDAMAIAIR